MDTADGVNAEAKAVILDACFAAGATISTNPAGEYQIRCGQVYAVGPDLAATFAGFVGWLAKERKTA